MTELGEFAMYAAVGGTSIAALIVISPIFKALANRIAGKGSDDMLAGVETRLAALEDRSMPSGEVEAQYVRIAELEERLDFAERMLAERTEIAQLPKETLQ